jgi:hypothetical protein
MVLEFFWKNEEMREGLQDSRCSQRDLNWDLSGKFVFYYSLQIDTQNEYSLKTASLFERKKVSLQFINTECAAQYKNLLGKAVKFSLQFCRSYFESLAY